MFFAIIGAEGPLASMASMALRAIMHRMEKTNNLLAHGRSVPVLKPVPAMNSQVTPRMVATAR